MFEIIVIDDCSTDDTGRIARELGATVLCPPCNTGSKAGAQSYALPYVWKQVMPLAGMAVAIILVLWAETWGIAKLVGRLPTFARLWRLAPFSSTVTILLALLPLVTLGMLVSALHTARLFLPREDRACGEDIGRT